MLTTYIFDIGNVLLSFHPAHFLPTVIEDRELAQYYVEHMFHNPLWLEFDRGVISQPDLIRRFQTSLPEGEHYVQLLFDRVLEYLIPLPTNIEMAFKLKAQGKRILLLSNFPKELYNLAVAHFDFLNRFDGGVISSHVHSIKPETAIYQAIRDKYNLIPVESIFIDDVLTNVKAAEQQGFQGHHYQNPEQLRAVLFPDKKC